MNRHIPYTFEFTLRGGIPAAPDNELMRPA